MGVDGPMTPWLSILIPSKRPAGLMRTLRSLEATSYDLSGVEIIVLVDAEQDQVVREGHNIVIGRPKDAVVNVSALTAACYFESCAPWIMLGNDDVVMETPGWDVRLRSVIDAHQDGVLLAWPADGMFDAYVACFAVISRRLLDATGFFPQPYRRYQIDATLQHIVPQERHVFMADVMLRHYNTSSDESGHRLPDGRVYPVDPKAAEYDVWQWQLEEPRRAAMRRKAVALMAGVEA
jgi:hypothetical protein